ARTPKHVVRVSSHNSVGTTRLGKRPLAVLRAIPCEEALAATRIVNSDLSAETVESICRSPRFRIESPFHVSKRRVGKERESGLRSLNRTPSTTCVVPDGSESAIGRIRHFVEKRERPVREINRVPVRVPFRCRAAERIERLKPRCTKFIRRAHF